MLSKKLILSVATIAIIYSGCEEKQTISTEEPIVEKKAETTVDKVANSVINNVESTAKKVEEMAKDIQKSTAPVVKDISKKVQDVQKSISQTTMYDVESKIKEVSAPVIKAVNDAVSTPDATGLYKKCAGCHGVNGEKVALGKSKIIKGWDILKTTNAINGYKDGSYGGVMKGLMKSQVNSLNDKEIEALSKLISTF